MTDEAMLRWDCNGLACRSKDCLELDRYSKAVAGFAADEAASLAPEFSCSMEEKVGLNEVPVPIGAAVFPLMGGLVSLPPKELEAVVDIS